MGKHIRDRCGRFGIKSRGRPWPACALAAERDLRGPARIGAEACRRLSRRTVR